MIIEVKVKSRSGRQEIVEVGENNYLAYLKSEAENNKANLELINLTAKYFNTPYGSIRIKRGLRSKNKVLEIL